MKSREELRRESACNPDGVAEYAFLLQEQLSEKDQLLAEARAYIAELKRQLFGPKADKLTSEQETQLQQLAGDVREQAQRPPPLSQDVLEPEPPPKDKIEKPARPRRRHPIPVQLEIQRQVLEPDDKSCQNCHPAGKPIGQEITTEYEYVAAKLICKETVRPKYAPDCPCEEGAMGRENRLLVAGHLSPDLGGTAGGRLPPG